MIDRDGLWNCRDALQKMHQESTLVDCRRFASDWPNFFVKILRCFTHFCKNCQTRHLSSRLPSASHKFLSTLVNTSSLTSPISAFSIHTQSILLSNSTQPALQLYRNSGKPAYRSHLGTFPMQYGFSAKVVCSCIWTKR